MDPIVYPSEVTFLTSKDFSYFIQLKETDSYDISGIELKFTEWIEKVRIWIAGSLVATFHCSMERELKTFPIYLSLLPYMLVKIELIYNKEWLKEHETVVMEDDYTEEIDYKEIVEIFDGYEYHTGQRVVRHQIPNGQKVRTIISPVEVMLPTVIFHRQSPINHPFDKSLIQQVPFEIDLSDYTMDELKRYTEKYQLKRINSKMGILQNNVWYQGGMAGVKYVF